MASHKNYQRPENKGGKTDLFRQKKSHQRQQSRSDRLMEGVAVWTAFYRSNPHRFVKDYLQLEHELKLFQIILLYAMMHNVYFAYVASRGQGKTYLIALFVIVKSILYPNLKVVVAAGQKSQAKEVIEKIAEFRRQSSNLQREIKDITTTGQDPKVEFHNGSTIHIVATNQGARGKRSNLLIIDELLLVPKLIIDSVFRKFQTAPRHVGFSNKKWFKELPEEERMALLDKNQEAYLTSATFKSHEAWSRIEDYAKLQAQGQSRFVCQLPYQLAIKEGILMRDSVQNEMDESGFDPITWSMEMGALFWGTEVDGFYSYEDIENNRKLQKVYYPKEITSQLGTKEFTIPTKREGEIRTIAADIALSNKVNADNSIFTVARSIPTKNGEYQTQYFYMESHHGVLSTVQAMRIRELYDEFNCDYIVLDTNGSGNAVYQQLILEQVSTETGKVYDPVSCMNNEDLANLCPYPNAPKVVFAVHANATLNSTIAYRFRDALRRNNKIQFPVKETSAQDILATIKNYTSLDTATHAALKAPFIQFNSFMVEATNLKAEYNDRKEVKLTEPRSGRKDRYSSVSYLNYFISEMENKNLRKNAVTHNEDIFTQFLLARPATLY